MRVEISVLDPVRGVEGQKELSLAELAKVLGVDEAEAFSLLEPIDKNLTVGDVHVSTALGNISTAYLQGEEEEDGEQEEEDESEQEQADESSEGSEEEQAVLEELGLGKSNDNRDDLGRFAEGAGGGGGHDKVQAHVAALTAAGSDRAAFEAAHSAMANDKSLTNNDLKRIAGRYLGGHIHSSKDTRSDVLSQFQRTFTAHARFQGKLTTKGRVDKYSDDEPRDEHGMWTSEGGGSDEKAQTVFRAHQELRQHLQNVASFAHETIGRMDQTFFRATGKRSIRKEEERDDHGRWTSGGASDAHGAVESAHSELTDHLSELENKMSDLEFARDALQETEKEEYDKSDEDEVKDHEDRLADNQKDVSKSAQASREQLQKIIERAQYHLSKIDRAKVAKGDELLEDEALFDFTVTKVDPDQRKVFGWASVSALDGVPVVDKQDDIIHIADLEKAAHDWALYSRTQGDMHTDIGVGRMVESVIFDQAKRDAGVVAKDDQGRVIDGWWVGFHVDDDDVWAAHKRGDRLEFSIGGRAQREPVEVAKENPNHDEHGRFAEGGGGAGDHVRALEGGLGNAGFAAAMGKLQSDASLSHSDLVGIAQKFGVKATASMSRAKVLASIQGRHEKLVRFNQTHVGPAA